MSGLDSFEQRISNFDDEQLEQLESSTTIQVLIAFRLTFADQRGPGPAKLSYFQNSNSTSISKSLSTEKVSVLYWRMTKHFRFNQFDVQ